MQRNKLWTIVIVVVVVVLGGIFILGHLLNADTWRGRIESSLSDSLGRPVQLGHLSFSIFSGSLVAQSLSIADDPAFSSQPFLTAQDLRIGVEVMPLVLHKDIHIQGLTIGQPKIVLLRNQNGVWNYSSLGSRNKQPSSPSQGNSVMPNLTVAKFAIRGGQIQVGTVPQTEPAHSYTDLDVDAQNFSLTSAFPFSVSGKLPGNGTLQLSGTAGPLNQSDASLTPVTAQLSLKHADLVAAGLVEPAQGISGVADLDMKIVSNGQTAHATGTLHATQLKLAKNGTPSTQPADLQFVVDQDLKSLSGKIESANIRVGAAALTLAGTYQTRGNVTSTQLNVNGNAVPIDALEAFLPSLGIQLPSGSKLQGGTLTTQLNVTGPVTAPVVAGPVRIANTQLAGFDLGSKLSSIRALTGAHTGSATVIQALSTNLQYGPSGTQLQNLAAVVSGLGSASGNGFVSPNNALNFHLLVKLDQSGGAAGMAQKAVGMVPGIFGSAVSQVTKNGIPVTIGGTSSNPTFTPDFGHLAGGATNPNSPPNQSPSNKLGNVLGGLLKGH